MFRFFSGFQCRTSMIVKQGRTIDINIDGRIIISGTVRKMSINKGKLHTTGCQEISMKLLLDIEYLGIQVCAQMRTQYSFGAKRARARMAEAH